MTRVLSLAVALLLLALPGPTRAQDKGFDKALEGLAKCTQANVRKCRSFKAVQEAVAKDGTRLAVLAKHEAVPVQKAALRIMSQEGPDKAALEALLAAADKDVRLEAVGLVANTNQRDFGEAILELAGKAYDGNDEQMLLKTIYALGRLQVEAASPLLVKLATDPVQKVSRAALAALAKAGGDETDKVILDLANDATAPAPQRRAALLALGNVAGRESTEVLLVVAQGDDAGLRLAALQALGVKRDKGAVPGLVDLLGKPEVAEQLVDTLGRIGGSKAASMLYTMSRDEERPEELRFKALCAAGKAGSKRAFDPLVKALDGSSTERRIAAAEALGYLADKRAVEPLFKRFQKARDREKTMLHWAIKRASGEALETEDQIKAYLKQ